MTRVVHLLWGGIKRTITGYEVENKPETPRVDMKASPGGSDSDYPKFPPTLGLHIAQSRSCLCTLGPKVGMIYILGALGLQVCK